MQTVTFPRDRATTQLVFKFCFFYRVFDKLLTVQQWCSLCLHIWERLNVTTPLLRFVIFLWCHVQTPWDSGFDVWWDEAMRDSPEECEPEWLNAEDPLFILYTSGSTGKPKVRPWCIKYKESCYYFYKTITLYSTNSELRFYTVCKDPGQTGGFQMQFKHSQQNNSLTVFTLLNSLNIFESKVFASSLDKTWN